MRRDVPNVLNAKGVAAKAGRAIAARTENVSVFVHWIKFAACRRLPDAFLKMRRGQVKIVIVRLRRETNSKSRASDHLFLDWTLSHCAQIQQR